MRDDFRIDTVTIATVAFPSRDCIAGAGRAVSRLASSDYISNWKGGAGVLRSVTSTACNATVA